MAAAAGKAVTQVVHRCDAAKENGFLDLSNCQMMYIPNAIYFVIKGADIWAISLAHNELKKFPKKLIEKLPDLKMINLSNNNIVELTHEIADCKRLRRLNLAWNALTEIPEYLLKMNTLESLDMQHNQIEDIDLSLFTSAENCVREIVLTGNPLSEECRQRINDLSDEKCKIRL